MLVSIKHLPSQVVFWSFSTERLLLANPNHSLKYHIDNSTGADVNQ